MKKDYIFCGMEFGLDNVGEKALIGRDFYGDKAAGWDFFNKIRACIRELDSVYCPGLVWHKKVMGKVTMIMYFHTQMKCY